MTRAVGTGVQRPAHRALFASRVAQRTITEMLGMLRGIVCDGVVTEDEVQAFNVWIETHPDATSVWPGSVLAQQVREIVQRQTISADDRHHLYELFCEVIGSGEREAAHEEFATRLPYNNPLPVLTFAGNAFVFTGTFIFGTRSQCAAEVVRRGGKVYDAITAVPLTLVIGTLGTESWAHSSYGRKIEKAVAYRDAGVPVQIVSEEHWTAALKA